MTLQEQRWWAAGGKSHVGGVLWGNEANPENESPQQGRASKGWGVLICLLSFVYSEQLRFALALYSAERGSTEKRFSVQKNWFGV